MPGSPLTDRVKLFGIRHHGPGSARSLIAAFNSWQPDLVLIEGAAETEALAEYFLHPEVRLPVAGLVYALDQPRRAVYYPLAEFSPEYQAMRWARHSRVPVRMMDLPASASLGLRVGDSGRGDLFEEIAAAAGFSDTEEWWEQLVEQRSEASDLFEGMEHLMTELRGALAEESDEVDDDEEVEDDRPLISYPQYEAIREASMRRIMREALAGSHQRIAVVCGAWHLPALRELPPAKHDDALLKGLPKLKVGATIVPWTFDRLTFASGYGAGARSPAFYDLLWRTPANEVPTRWLLAAARLMRNEDLDASPASVIEAVRLAEALAALRGHPRAGLRELCEAASSVLIYDQVIWDLIGRKLIVGDRMGEVPPSVPLIPLQSDLTALQKRLRMKVDDTERLLELDLRGEIDLERSHLLHRLTMLGIHWGIPHAVSGKKGTFHEHWQMRWGPELTISLIEASVYGSTVESAATNRACEKAGRAKDLPTVSALVEEVLLAALPEAVEPVVRQLQALSATGSDVAELAASLPPLANAVRYGTVRRMEVGQIVPVLDAIFTRLCLGLPTACASLDDDAARDMAARLTSIGAVVNLFQDEGKTAEWKHCLDTLANQNGCHAIVTGKAERLRFDLGDVDGDYLALRLSQEASAGATALETAAFLEGLLDGPGAILIHQDSLFKAIDEWLTELRPEVFEEIMPLIRRTFALFTKPERRQLGERVTGGAKVSAVAVGFNEERARQVLPVVRMILGVSDE